MDQTTQHARPIFKAATPVLRGLTEENWKRNTAPSARKERKIELAIKTDPSKTFVVCARYVNEATTNPPPGTSP